MKIAVLHSGNIGFFPRFYKSIKERVEKAGDECVLLIPNSGRNQRNPLPNQILFGSRLNWFIHSHLYRLTGLEDVFSFFETLDLLYKLKIEKPDVIHLNLINDKCLNIPLFVRFVNRHHIPVVWTMHDCRAFTGKCPYFDEVECERWKTGCGQCPQIDTWIDGSHRVWKIRNKWHNIIENLTIVTPSQWLENFIKQSMLKKKSVMVIYNGVDTEGFQQKIDFNIKERYNIPHEKKIVLGCAINWEQRKGMKFFEQLTEPLPNEYQIVLVGNIPEEKQVELSKKGIICTGRTKTFEELVAWYQQSDVFCNPTLSDNFPTTNIEALAAGLPIVTFRTGGSPEAIDEKTGIVVEQGDVQGLCDAVRIIATNRNVYTCEACRKRSKLFSNKQYDKYIELYHETIKTGYDK